MWSIGGLGIARETVTHGSFVSVELAAYHQGRARWLEVLQTLGENE